MPASDVLLIGMIPRALIFGLVFSLFTAAFTPVSPAADYGTKVAFRKAAPLEFPDFILTYVGERRAVSAPFPRGFLHHDFSVAGAAGTQTISWSSGTGDIGPALFRVGSKQFALELSRSDKLGPLKPNELVISRAP